MTREEKQKAIDALKISAPVMAMTQEEFTDYIQTLNKVMDWLEQEPTTENDLGVDCISRQAVIDGIKEYFHDEYYQRTSIQDCRDCFIEDVLNHLPSVTPQEPRKGHWIVQPSNKEQGERNFIWWKCSECGQVIYSETEKDRKEFHAFCGRCGADMGEVEK